MLKANNKKIYDYIIIGAGPSAYASLYALRHEKIKLGVITGYDKTKISKNNHNHIIDRYKSKYSIKEFFHINNYKLFSPGIIGGLSNFWGGGFFCTKFENLYDFKKIFKNENTYKSIIKKFDINLNVDFIQAKKKIFIKNYKKINGFYLEDKKIFKKKIVNVINSKKSFKIYNSLVENIKRNKTYFDINLQNLRKIRCKKIILTAGVLGNISILKKSFAVKSFSFYDDTPWLVYLLNFNKNFLEKYRLTNFINIAKSINLFTSFYNFKFVRLNELLYFFIKKKINILNFNFNFPFSNIFTFGQIWTKNTRVKIFVKDLNCTYDNLNKTDIKLSNFIQSLRQKKIFKIYAKRQSPGYGFHYHNLNIIYKNKNFRIHEFLKLKFGKNLICNDASIILKTSPISVTSTIMAIAYQLTKKLIKN